jgi:hypothetical protein
MANSMASGMASSQATVGAEPEPFGFLLEDGTGLLEAENNDDLEQEEAP